MVIKHEKLRINPVSRRDRVSVIGEEKKPGFCLEMVGKNEKC
ncbi:MAG: hypothetical protein ACRCT1_23610 [Microcoleaceae cyanobacterium]